MVTFTHSSLETCNLEMNTYLRPILTRHFLRFSFGRYSNTNIVCMALNKETVNWLYSKKWCLCIVNKGGQGEALVWGWLTGSPLVTTPSSRTTLGCLNCAMIAASCRSLTLSVSRELIGSDLTATSCTPLLFFQMALSTSPNWPAPRWAARLMCQE